MGILEMVINKNALILRDHQILKKTLGVNISIPMPLLGFIYELPQSIELLNFTYSEYPFINKSLVANSTQNETTTIKVTAISAITAENGIVKQFLKLQVLQDALRDYCVFGGSFWLITPWGVFRNLYLENLTLIPSDNSFGCKLEFTLKRLNFTDSPFAKKVSTALSYIDMGML